MWRGTDLAVGSSSHLAISNLFHQQSGRSYHPLCQLARRSAGVLLLNGPMTRWSNGQMTQRLSPRNLEPASREFR